MISGLYIRRCTILRLSSVRSRRPYSVDSKSFKGTHHTVPNPIERAHSDLTNAEGDIVLLRPSKEPTRLKDAREAILTKPLGPSHIIQTPGGAIRHSAIIGLRLRDPVTTAKGIEYRVHEPSLAEYVCLCPRVVTPVCIFPEAFMDQRLRWRADLSSAYEFDCQLARLTSFPTMRRR
jgi:hypothetical protein